jgi:hypothetical protein
MLFGARRALFDEFEIKFTRKVNVTTKMRGLRDYLLTGWA